MHYATPHYWCTLIRHYPIQFDHTLLPYLPYSEVTIRVFENFLRPYVERNPVTWAAQLSLAEFAANNAISSSAKYTPFFLNAGQHPSLPGSMMIPDDMSENPAVQDLWRSWKMHWHRQRSICRLLRI